eukprot:14290135-Ditylum_brightwellii.AAC.2
MDIKLQATGFQKNAFPPASSVTDTPPSLPPPEDRMHSDSNSIMVNVLQQIGFIGRSQHNPGMGNVTPPSHNTMLDNVKLNITMRQIDGNDEYGHASVSSEDASTLSVYNFVKYRLNRDTGIFNKPSDDEYKIVIVTNSHKLSQEMITEKTLTQLRAGYQLGTSFEMGLRFATDVPS